MINFNIKLLGLDRLLKKTGGLGRGVADAIAGGMREAAFVVEREGKSAITTGATRAILTGYLRSSIGVASILPYRATVQAGANYGIYVHEGTRYMRERPFLKVGLKNAVPEIERIFGKRIKTMIQLT